MIKIGDSLVCVNNQDTPLLTVGKIYKVIRKDEYDIDVIHNGVYVKNDKGNIYGYFLYRFKKVTKTKHPEWF